MATADFTQLYNHHEREVFAAVMDSAPDYPDIAISNDLLCDVACVALNRLPPRYIRHAVDFSFYLTEQERSEVIKSLIDLKNTLIRQGKYTDAVDDVLVKLTGAKRKKLKVVYI